jgi:hypothetical protein
MISKSDSNLKALGHNMFMCTFRCHLHLPGFHPAHYWFFRELLLGFILLDLFVIDFILLDHYWFSRLLFFLLLFLFLLLLLCHFC